MQRNWMIIPDFARREESAELAEKYQAGFEYNDFFLPQVYENEQETERRIEGYCSLNRDRSRDTLHGAFLDVVVSSDDTYIAEYSKKKLRQSAEIARKLSVKGVVFHSGLVYGVIGKSYLENWAKRQSMFYRELCAEYSELEFYLENTQETSPELLLPLLEQMKDCKNFKICFDYAHAAISGTAVATWLEVLQGSIAHMHINDNDLRADLHQVPGEGCINWTEFASLTKKLEDVSVLVELNGLEHQEKALNYLRKVE